MGKVILQRAHKGWKGVRSESTGAFNERWANEDLVKRLGELAADSVRADRRAMSGGLSWWVRAMAWFGNTLQTSDPTNWGGVTATDRDGRLVAGYTFAAGRRVLRVRADDDYEMTWRSDVQDPVDPTSDESLRFRGEPSGRQAARVQLALAALEGEGLHVRTESRFPLIRDA